jgi:hypothetical protein
MALIDKRMQSLFYGESGATRSDIIRCWEKRRLRYNLYVGLVGFVAWWLVLIAGIAAVRLGQDFEEPIAMLPGPVLYGIVANFCFTFAWITDVALYRGGPRNGLFKAGFIPRSC